MPQKMGMGGKKGKKKDNQAEKTLQVQMAILLEKQQTGNGICKGTGEEVASEPSRLPLFSDVLSG